MPVTAAAVDDRDDEHAVVQEDLGQLVSEKSSPTSMCSVFMCLPTGSSTQARALLERLVERARDEARVAERLEVAGKQRADELALAEDPQQLAARVDDRQRGRVGLDEPRDGVAQALVVAQQRDLAADGAGDPLRAHLVLLFYR